MAVMQPDSVRSSHSSRVTATVPRHTAWCQAGSALKTQPLPLPPACCRRPQRFAAVIMRIREPKTTALIFASGKMVCTGAKSEQDSKLAAKKVCGD